jgi:transmembrane sensor
MSGDAPSVPDVDTALSEAAAWRIRLAEAGVETSPDFEGWLAASETNLAAWRRIQAPWRLLGEHASAPPLVERRREALARAERASRATRQSWSNWRRFAAVALVALALGGAGVGGFLWLNGQPQRFATELGERRSVLLSDGSRVSLDSASQVLVRYAADARRLELVTGQARFDVAHDAARPFSVRARGHTVIALGTAFNIDLMGEALRVTLIEGSATVVEGEAADRARASERGQRVVLGAGQQLIAAPDAVAMVEPVSINRAIAWERGQIDFADEELGDVAARVSRYTTRQVVITDPDLRAMRLSGVVNTGELADFIDLVTTYLPVEAVAREDGDVELRRRAA